MNNVLKINFGKRQRLTSLLGLSLDGNRLEGVVLRRSNGSLQIQQTFAVTLSLDPLTAAPELVGREIRNHLEAAGVRERHCVVGVPLKWTFTAHTELPPLPEADAASLLQLEAERGFPSDVLTLQVSNSRCSLAGNKQYVTLAGIPKNQIAALTRCLTAAKLKPVSFSLGVTALQPPDDGKSTGVPSAPARPEGVLALTIRESVVGLQITSHGGVAALRTLEGVIETEGSRRALQTGLVAREARITLGQMPAELRDRVRCIRIFGPRELAQPLADEMELRFEPMGLSVEMVTAYAPDEFGFELPPNTPVSAAFSLAARRLAGRLPVFEFLPPKLTILEQFAAKYSSGKLRTIGAVAAGIIVIILGIFLFQEIQLLRLRSQWSAMSANVQGLSALQKKIQTYQPWFDSSYRSLAILKQLTTAFPEDGSVTAKSVEIRDDGGTVTCSGSARDSAALLRTLGQLRAADGVGDMKVEQIRGTAPMQFTFDFHWGNGNGGQP